jgi:uncharacterized protein involved in type VI secretion and phage assembly
MRTGELYQRYYGLYVATVVDVNDPEKLGRVRLETDQFDDSKDDPVWAAVARPAGGVDTSVFFTPKTGDQVIIGYIVGDVNEPVVMGYAHSKKLPKPSQVDTKKHGVVTNIGSVVFDEDAKKITVTFSAGGPESTFVMSNDGIEIKAPHIKMNADTVCINDQAVVLKNFIDFVYNQHMHPTAFGPTAIPIPRPIPPPLPPQSTDCLP